MEDPQREDGHPGGAQPEGTSPVELPGVPDRFRLDVTRIVRLGLLAAVACAAVAGWWLWAPGPDPVPTEPGDTAQPGSAAGDPTAGGVAGETGGEAARGAGDRVAGAPETITVHVSGAVAVPGLVEIPAGSRVADAVAGAGGALPTAELSALNLAAPVGDGQQISVPGPGSGGGVGSGDGGGSGDSAGTGDGGPVAINRADTAALETLPGVGPVLAGRIIAHREEEGPFARVEDLLDVTGIGETRLEALRDLVVVP